MYKMENHQQFYNTTTPAILLKNILMNHRIYTQLTFDFVRRFQYRITDGRFVTVGLGLFIYFNKYLIFINNVIIMMKNMSFNIKMY